MNFKEGERKMVMNNVDFTKSKPVPLNSGFRIDKENPKSYSRTILFENGEKKTFGSFERPFILFEDGKPLCIYGAVSNGENGFLDATETWIKERTTCIMYRDWQN